MEKTSSQELKGAGNSIDSPFKLFPGVDFSKRGLPISQHSFFSRRLPRPPHFVAQQHGRTTRTNTHAFVEELNEWQNPHSAAFVSVPPSPQFLGAELE